MRKAYVIVLVGAALVLGGCSAATQVFENMPQSMGGLSSDAPKAPDAPYLYPAVHDMPAPRDSKLLSDQEQEKLEKDLLSAREAQEKAAAADAQASQNPPPPPAQSAKPAKNNKKPDDKAGSAAKP